MSHEITVRKPWFDFICQGEKTVEGRVNRGKFTSFNPGDHLVIKSADDDAQDMVVGTITCVGIYTSFEAMLNSTSLRRTLPGVRTIAEGVSEFRKFYSREVEAEHGVLAIYFELDSPYTD